MIQDFEKFHEEETFFLITTRDLELNALRNALFKFGFEEIDDFFSLKRKERVSQWQSLYLANIEVFHNNHSLDLIEEEPWNKLKISYLFATLPFTFTEAFINITFNIAEELNLTVKYGKRDCSKEYMLMLFHEYREDVREALDGEPGSEIVRINIAMSYPRN